MSRVKSDKVTTLKRIQEIYQMICQGANTLEIIEYCRVNWEIKSAQAYNLLKRTMKYLREKTDKSTEDYRTEANARLDKLYTKLYKEGKYRDAIYAQSQKNKINGIEIQKIEHTGKIKIDKTEYEKLPDETDIDYEKRLKNIYEQKLKEVK